MSPFYVKNFVFSILKKAIALDLIANAIAFSLPLRTRHLTSMPIFSKKSMIALEEEPDDAAPATMMMMATT